MGVQQAIGEHRADVLRIARDHGATRVRIFGSVAKGAAGPTSDLDLLVDLAPGRNLLDLIAIKQDLDDILGHTVDVVTEAVGSFATRRPREPGRALSAAYHRCG